MELLLFPVLIGAYLVISNVSAPSVGTDVYLVDEAALELPPAAEPAPAESSSAEALALTERIGLTAGQIWRYLAENGAVSVADLLTAIGEEERIVLFSVGWLAREEKIGVERIGDGDYVALKD